MQDFSISIEKLNKYVLTVVFPLVLPFFGLYIYFWGWNGIYSAMINDSSPLSFFALVALVIGSIYLRIVIIGSSWRFFGKKNANAVKYVTDLETKSPFIYCDEPIKIGAYRLGLAMPGTLLGILPVTIGILSGIGFVFILGVFGILLAGGEIYILWAIRKVEPRALVKDHSLRVGCYIILSD